MTCDDVFTLEKVPAYFELSNAAYHDGAGISSSGLKLIGRSPAHYWAAYLDPEREPRKETPALILGDQIHAAVLEPDRYFKEFYPLPDKFNRATKQGKADAEWHEAEAARLNQRVISAENHSICQRIAEAVHNSPAASTLFEMQGLVEKSFYWHDEETGVLCKARPDKLLGDAGVILDLKSSGDASYRTFSRDAFSYAYHLSAALYLRGVEAVTGERPKSFIYVAFEKEPPFACAVYNADEDMIRLGDEEVTRLLRVYADCLESDHWPGYPDQIIALKLPNWAFSKTTD